MGHGHDHAPFNYGRAFAVGIGANAAFVVFEATFGFLSGSVALLADAGHNLSDVMGLILAWVGVVLARRPATLRRTYGLRRSTILAALANALLLVAAAAGIGWEAVHRLIAPEPPPDMTMVWVAATGIVVNTATALFFFSGRHHDVNIRGAYLHLAADAAVSLGVVVAGLLVQRTQWTWLDPVIGLVIVVVILISTWDLLRESLDLALDAVPKNIDPAAVAEYLKSQSDVVDVHALHIWGLSTTEAALTVHLVAPHGAIDDARLTDITRQLHDRFGIEHVTVQVERATDACPADMNHRAH